MTGLWVEESDPEHEVVQNQRKILLGGGVGVGGQEAWEARPEP